MITQLSISKFNQYKDIEADVEIDGELFEVQSIVYIDNGIVKSLDPKEVDDQLIQHLEMMAFNAYRLRDDNDDDYDAKMEGY